MIHLFSLPLTDHNQLANAIHTSICSRNLIVVVAEGNASHESTGVEVVLELYLFVDRVQRCIFLYVHACTHELDRLAVVGVFPPHHFEVHVYVVVDTLGKLDDTLFLSVRPRQNDIRRI